MGSTLWVRQDVQNVDKMVMAPEQLTCTNAMYTMPNDQGVSAGRILRGQQQSVGQKLTTILPRAAGACATASDGVLMHAYEMLHLWPSYVKTQSRSWSLL